MAFPKYGGSSIASAPVLLTQPGASVPAAIGKGGARVRYRHVTGPNAIAKRKPISALLPIRPNAVAR